MLRRVCVLVLPVLVGCGGSTISSSTFDDPAQDDGATTAESGGEDDSGSTAESSIEDSEGTAVDSSIAPDTAESADTAETPDTSADDTGSTPDTSTPPEDTGPGTPDTPVTVACTEPNAATFGGHCYFPINKRTWQNARDFCVSLGAHLATINSDAEQAFLNKFYVADDRWVGLYRPNGTALNASSYKWVTSEPVTYKRWATGEPNFTGQCVRIRNDGTWADQNCTFSLYGICERE